MWSFLLGDERILTESDQGHSQKKEKEMKRRKRGLHLFFACRNQKVERKSG